MSTLTPEQEDTLIAFVEAIQQAVDASPQGIPPGHLYACLMQHISLDTYNQIIGAMIKAGRIKQSNFLLTSARQNI